MPELRRRARAPPARAPEKLANIPRRRSAYSSRKAAENALPETALICRVPEAERYIAHYRQRFDPSARRNVPAHVTILYPFMAPPLVDADVLGDVARHRGVRAVLQLSHGDDAALSGRVVSRARSRRCRSPRSSTAYFARFRTIRRSKASSTPSCRTSPSRMATSRCCARSKSSCASRCRGAGVAARCTELVLIENSSGRWEPMDAFELGSKYSDSDAGARRC